MVGHPPPTDHFARVVAPHDVTPPTSELPPSLFLRRVSPGRGLCGAPSIDQTTPLTEQCQRLWDLLRGKALDSNQLAEALDTSAEAIRGAVSKLRAQGFDVQHKKGIGYYRKDSPPE